MLCKTLNKTQKDLIVHQHLSFSVLNGDRSNRTEVTPSDPTVMTYLHEIAHWRRRDYIANAGLKVAKSFWL
jgi:hypothetical protein